MSRTYIASSLSCRAKTLLALVLILALTGPAFAQTGGDGGGRNGFGLAGASSATGAGANGGNGRPLTLDGGSGGGAGVTGGNGGVPFAGVGGGAGAAVAGGNGGNATAGSGAGGGGGAHGAVITTTTTNSAALSGGQGGAGANAFGNGGGGGGAGGYGAVVNGTVTYTNTSTITGGDGGVGGLGSPGLAGGNGGDAGYGIAIAVPGATLINNGTIIGGTGGNGGNGFSFGSGGAGEAAITGDSATINNVGTITGGNGGTRGSIGTVGFAGVAGAGISGSNLTITDSGAIGAGLNGDGVTRGNALTFTGGANTLTLQTGWSLTGDIAVNGGASLIFNQSILVTLSNSITGSGTITQSGSGLLTLDGNSSSFSGSTVVSGAGLQIGGAGSPSAILGGAVSVVSGGTLFGGGTIGGNLSNVSGRVMPGAGGVGTLTVNGNYTQGAGGTLVAQLTPAAASLLAVSGTASLGGTLEAVPSAGSYGPNAHIAILTAGGGVTGTFATFINDLPALNLSVDYLTNEVDLVVTGSRFVGTTRNEMAVANALNTAFTGATGDFATVLGAAAILPQAQIPQTLASLGGQIYANLAEVSLQDRRLFLGAMDDRLQAFGAPADSSGAAVLGSSASPLQVAALSQALAATQVADAAPAHDAAPMPNGAPNHVWARGFGQFGSLNSNGGALGADYSTGGGAFGAELIHTPQTVLGVAVSGGQSSVSTNTLPESGTIAFVQFGMYGAQALGYGLTADGAAIYAHDFYDVSRSIVLPGTSRTANSSHGGDDVALDLGISRPLHYGAWQITPRAGLSYFHIGQANFVESGANSLDLSVNPATLDALRSRLGAAVSQAMTLGDLHIVPELRAAWTHDFLDDRGAIGATFVGAPSATFTQIGAATGRDAADLGAGIGVAIAQSTLPGQLSAFMQYDATVAAHQVDHSIAAGVKLTW